MSTTGSLSADEQKLADLGYKQELNRRWSNSVTVTRFRRTRRRERNRLMTCFALPGIRGPV